MPVWNAVSFRNPDMDMISIGPDLQHPHSPDERVSIPSVARTWDFIVTTLARI